MPITFARGATSITLPDPRAPYKPAHPPRQRIQYSGGGAIRVAIMGQNDNRIDLPFVRMEDDEYQALLGFIQSTIVYAAYPFTYTTVFGVDIENVRYIEGIDTFEQQAKGQRWSGTLALRKDLGE